MAKGLENLADGLGEEYDLAGALRRSKVLLKVNSHGYEEEGFRYTCFHFDESTGRSDILYGTNDSYRELAKNVYDHANKVNNFEPIGDLSQIPNGFIKVGNNTYVGLHSSDKNQGVVVNIH